MRNFLSLFIIGGLAFNVDASSRMDKNSFDLAAVSQLVASSRDYNDLVIRTFPGDIYRQKVLLEYGRKHEISKLPKVNYKNKELALTEPTGEIVKISFDGTFKINGKSVPLSYHETIDSLSTKIEAAMTKKTSLIQEIFWSEAHAISYIVVAGVAIVVGALYITSKSDACDNVASEINKPGKSNLTIKEVMICSPSESEVHATDLLDPGQVHTIGFSKQEEWGLEGELVDQRGKEAVTKFHWTRKDDKRDSPLELQSVESNGEIISVANNPEKFKDLQKIFENYYPAVKSLTTERGTLSKSCIQCKDKINQELANPKKPGLLNRVFGRKKTS